MAHLPSYKSFNFNDVEEIENRVFCPQPDPIEHALKVCPGSLSFQDDLHHNLAEHVHHSNWRRIKHNVSIIHPNRSKTPEIVHFNENFPDHDVNSIELSDEDNDDINVMQIEEMVKEKLKKRTELTITNLKTPATSVNVRSSVKGALQLIEDKQEVEPEQRCLFCRCSCKK